MEYTVVYGQDVYDLEKSVQEHLEEGWMPQGGLVLVTSQGRYATVVDATYQAMIRRPDEVVDVPDGD